MVQSFHLVSALKIGDFDAGHIDFDYGDDEIITKWAKMMMTIKRHPRPTSWAETQGSEHSPGALVLG